MSTPTPRPRAFVEADDVGILESPEAVLTTLTKEGDRRWMYPTPSKGRFWTRRLALGWALIAFFVALPVVRIGGKPAVLLDVVHREFTFFGFTFYPTDTFLLLLLGVAALLGVVFLTALLGRVWCGWGCPQTVYLEFVFRPIERWIEGKEHVRQRRDEGPLTLDKAWRKAAKWAVYTVLAVGLAHTFVAYFVGWDRLVAWMTGPPTEQWGFFVLMAGTTALMLFDFGVFREQMCTIACPYARMQSVLLDPDSLIVSYDPNRGEPRARRGKKKLRQEEAGLLPQRGDCIDCFACVRTCPTGIDIRDGLQMECVACTQCIDACDAIMDRIGKPRGLIRYTSERELDGKRTRWLRGRTVLYAGLLLAVSTVFTIALTTRGTYDVNVGRAVGEPYTVLPDGQIANRLRFRVHNQTPNATAFTIGVAEPEGASVRVVGVQPVGLEAQEMARTEVWVLLPPETFGGAPQQEGTFALTFTDGTVETVPFTLLGPMEQTPVDR
ncbi:MAG: cytochrome c oxidase accessory protein CcoG [Rhodothermales bacterium]|nr:cytochrome c oxidase accessory protein CcoG [Rhodothermales bacterium]